MKNMLILFLLAYFNLIMKYSYAQETRFFMPFDIKKAYENGTRSYNGMPGVKYWQNTVDYNIKVTIDPPTRSIIGTEEVVYYNSSPDEINSLVVRLYYDVFKKGNLRAVSIRSDDVSEGVRLNEVIIDNTMYDIDDPEIVKRTGTNITFQLKKPLKSGERLTFICSWIQKIPLGQWRTGTVDSTTFVIAYWYPQISVYDDITGWDILNYTLQTEFYNNLANYDVEITVPNDYIVWATGTLKNYDEVLPEKIYKRYEKARNSEEAVHIMTKEDIDNRVKMLNNTWHYKASEVSDFAFAMSNHYLWDAAVQFLDDRKVFINSVFPIDTIVDHFGLTSMQQKAMKHFSEDIPGIPYPYEAFTAFIGFGGMEYPMMTNIEEDWFVVHEMFHTYFPMYVRTNERMWAWMDEGWAEYFEAVILKRYFDNDPELANIFSRLIPYKPVGSIRDLPLITSSQFLDQTNYPNASYSLAGVVYGIIHQHLGNELFLKCIREYIRRWAKKSPTPYDFFYTFEDVSDQDLSWIWKPWFFEFGVPDVAIESFKDGKLTIVNYGNKPVPLFVEVKDKNNHSKFFNQSAHIWAENKNEIQLTISDFKNVEKIIVNAKVVDVNPFDNFFPSILSFYENIDVDSILGRYILIRDQGTILINITIQDGIMHYEIPDFQVDRIIYPESKLKFKSFVGMELEFILDKSGSYAEAKVNNRGYNFNIKKLK